MSGWGKGGDSAEGRLLVQASWVTSGLVLAMAGTVQALGLTPTALLSLPIPILLMGCLALERRGRSAAARASFVLVSHLAIAAYSYVDGYGPRLHLVALASVPLAFSLFRRDERTLRWLALLLPGVTLVGVELAGRAGLLPGLLTLEQQERLKPLTVLVLVVQFVAQVVLLVAKLERAERGLRAERDVAVRQRASLEEARAHLAQQKRRLEEAIELARKGEERLLEERRRLENAQALARVGDWSYEPRRGHMRASSELLAIFELRDIPTGTLTAELLWSRLVPADRALFVPALQVAMAQGERIQTAARLALPSGRARHVQILGEPVAPEESARGYRGTVQDVTAAREAELAHIEAKESAEALARSKANFLAMVSHELRTPLNGMLGMTSLALSTELTREQREYVETAHVSAQSLLALINDILDLARLDAGRIELVSEPMSLELVCREAVSAVVATAHAKGLELVVELDPGLPRWVQGDAQRLRQVLVNLLGNAVKFTDAGEVCLKLGRGDGEDYVRGEVRDTGPGIAVERQEAIFEAFTQANAATTRRYGGTGLGLTIARELVLRMGGQISVWSRPGEGARFDFDARLPPEVELCQETPPRPMPAVSVLLIEPNDAARRATRAQLEAHGIRVDARAGLPAEEAPPGGLDLALVAVQAERVGEILGALGQLGVTCALLAPAAARPNADTLAQLGAPSLLTKPLLPTELLRAIRELVRRPEAPAEQRAPCGPRAADEVVLPQPSPTA